MTNAQQANIEAVNSYKAKVALAQEEYKKSLKVGDVFFSNVGSNNPTFYQIVSIDGLGVGFKWIGREFEDDVLKTGSCRPLLGVFILSEVLYPKLGVGAFRIDDMEIIRPYVS